MNDIQERLLFTYAIICMMIITFVSAGYIFNTIIDTLCTDQSFQEKLNSTFQNPSLETYQALITCLNEPTNDNTFFSKYTELFNVLGTSYTTNDSTNRKEIEQEIKILQLNYKLQKWLQFVIFYNLLD